MTTSIVLTCNTTRGWSSCTGRLLTDALTIAEARTIAGAHGWRHTTAGRDYCPTCSGTRERPRVILAIPGTPPQPDRPAHRLEEAQTRLLALVNQATGGLWRPGRTPAAVRDLPGIEFVTGGPHGADCVARTGPAGNPQAASDAAYIATMHPDTGRAVASLLAVAVEDVPDEHDETALHRGALDIADAILGTPEAAR